MTLPVLTVQSLRRIPLSHLTFIIKWIEENVDGAANFVKDAQRQLESDASSNLPE